MDRQKAELESGGSVPAGMKRPAPAFRIKPKQPNCANSTLAPEQVLRDYFHAKDENRPHLLAKVFSADAQLDICNRSNQISFPATTTGLHAIADVLVRRFNQTYENIYSFYLSRPGPDDETFSCDWVVGMTDKESRRPRVGCGRYAWTFQRTSTTLASRLTITIETMMSLDQSRTSSVLDWISQLQYPWTSVPQVLRTLPRLEFAAIRDYLGREIDQTRGRD